MILSNSIMEVRYICMLRYLYLFSNSTAQVTLPSLNIYYLPSFVRKPGHEIRILVLAVNTRDFMALIVNRLV